MQRLTLYHVFKMLSPSVVPPCSKCLACWQQVANVVDTVVKAPRCRKFESWSNDRFPIRANKLADGVMSPDLERFRIVRTNVRMRLLGSVSTINPFRLAAANDLQLPGLVDGAEAVAQHVPCIEAVNLFEFLRQVTLRRIIAQDIPDRDPNPLAVID